MELISIGSTAPMDKLKERLVGDIGFLIEEGLILKGNQDSHKSVKVLSLWADSKKESSFTLSELRTLSRQCVASAIAEHIVEDNEPEELRKLVDAEYGYFTNEEQRKIVELCIKLLRSEELYLSSRKTKIREKLTPFLARQRHVNIQGFMKFRLHDYYAELRENVSKAVDDFLVEKEYSEFIRLLRYFVEIQDPKLPVVHIRVAEADRCELFDQFGKALHHDYLDTFEPEGDEEVSYEDLLISALITLAPERIVLHLGDSGNSFEIVDTIINVFEERVSTCSRCELCFSGVLSAARMPIPKL